ncbi:MAG TPA: RlpA-like double-psi beta-barrel domain-containing protein [Actinomycetota bacterium]|nr:RlpA-like double-psi beta-barrel domain-containing protein [Actinomycetota bacterium]
MRGAVRLLLTLLVAAGTAGYLHADGRATLADRNATRTRGASSVASMALTGEEGTVGAAARAPAPGPAAGGGPAGQAAIQAAASPADPGSPATTTTAAPAAAPVAPAPVVTVTVWVVHDGQTNLVTTTAGTVGQMLQGSAIHLSSLDKVSPAPATPLTGGTTIRVYRVTQTVTSTVVSIHYKKVTKSSNTVEMGLTATASTGVNGTTEKDYTKTYQDGRLMSDVLSATKIIVPERDAVTLVGSGQPTFVSHGGSQSGAGSWYATAGLSAASPTLPFGTVVKVTDVSNGRTINVVIRDRGPSTGGGRVIDLSPTAFSHLSSLGSGVISVKLQW